MGREYSVFRGRTDPEEAEKLVIDSLVAGLVFVGLLSFAAVAFL